MQLFLHNLSVTNLALNDIGVVIPASSYFEIDTASLNDLLRTNSALKGLIAGGTYNTDLVISTNVNPLSTAFFLTAVEANAVLTNGTADEIYFDASATDIIGKTVRSAIVEVNTKLGTLSSGITWRTPVFAITGDAQLTAGGTVSLTGMTFPLSDDEAPTQLVVGDFTAGKYVLYSDGTPANDKIYLVVGTNLVQQTAVNGVVAGYTYVVDNDLLDTPDVAEKYALYLSTPDGLKKIGDIDFNASSLQKSYAGGSTITLTNGNALTIKNYTGLKDILTVLSNGTGTQYKVDADVVTFKDTNLTSGIALSETGANTFIANEWINANAGGTTGNGVFDWSRTNSPNAPVSLVGGISALRDDLNETVRLLNTAPAVTDGDVNGGNLIGIKGLTTVTPTGGTAGANGSLQAVLEGINTKINNVANSAGGKSYANITAFTTAKGAGTTYQLNELVWIADANRQVEVLVLGTAVVENTDWVYIGSANALIATTLQVDVARVKIADTKAFVLPSNTTTAELNAVKVVDGVTYVYNGTAWLSSNRSDVTFGAISADGQFLSLGSVSSGLNGWITYRNAQIKAFAFYITGGNLAKNVSIYKNGALIATATYTNASGKVIVDNLAFDIVAGDVIQIFVDSTGAKALKVTANIEIAYRA